MLRDWNSRPKVVGVKQSRRAIREGRALQVFLATNADPALTAHPADIGFSGSGIIFRRPAKHKQRRCLKNLEKGENHAYF